jgi:hypothetical protein
MPEEVPHEDGVRRPREEALQRVEAHAAGPDVSRQQHSLAYSVAAARSRQAAGKVD